MRPPPSAASRPRVIWSTIYSSSSSDGRRAKVLGIISFYGAVVRPPAPQSKPPMLVADLVNECVLDGDNKWQFKSHVLQPVFMSHEAPPSLAIDTRR